MTRPLPVLAFEPEPESETRLKATQAPCCTSPCRYLLPSGACTLDVAAEGPHTLEEVGAHMHLTRERIRQIEVDALRKLRAGLAEWDASDWTAPEHMPTRADAGREAPEPVREDPWTAMAGRALERLDWVEPVPGAIVAAYLELAVTERPRLGAVARRARVRGSQVVWAALRTAVAEGVVLPFWKERK